MVRNDGAPGITQLVVCVHGLPGIMRSLLVRTGIGGHGSRSHRRFGWSGSYMSPAVPKSVKIV